MWFLSKGWIRRIHGTRSCGGLYRGGLSLWQEMWFVVIGCYNVYSSVWLSAILRLLWLWLRMGEGGVLSIVSRFVYLWCALFQTVINELPPKQTNYLLAFKTELMIFLIASGLSLAKTRRIWFAIYWWKDASQRYTAEMVLKHRWVACGGPGTLLETPRVIRRNNSAKDLAAFAESANAMKRLVLRHQTYSTDFSFKTRLSAHHENEESEPMAISFNIPITPELVFGKSVAAQYVDLTIGEVSDWFPIGWPKVCSNPCHSGDSQSRQEFRWTGTHRFLNWKTFPSDFLFLDNDR